MVLVVKPTPPLHPRFMQHKSLAPPFATSGTTTMQNAPQGNVRRYVCASWALLWAAGHTSLAPARPPQSLPLKVVAPPPPAPSKDTRAAVLEVSAGENGLARLRPPSVSLSTSACSLNPVVLAVL